MNRIFIDTGYIVALVSQRDGYHDRAMDLAQRYQSQRIVTTEAVLLEIGNALARQYRQQAADIIRSFLTSIDVEIVRLDASLFDRALSLYESYQDKEWGLVDCISFIVMRDMQVHMVLTFDKHFEQAGFQMLS